MAKEKVKRITGRIFLYSSPNDTKPSATRKYDGKFERKRILSRWEKLYKLSKRFYIIQIAPDVD